VHRFEHPDPGLNAAAWLVVSGGRVMRVGLSMAL